MRAPSAVRGGGSPGVGGSAGPPHPSPHPEAAPLPHRPANEGCETRQQSAHQTTATNEKAHVNRSGRNTPGGKTRKQTDSSERGRTERSMRPRGAPSARPQRSGWRPRADAGRCRAMRAAPSPTFPIPSRRRRHFSSHPARSCGTSQARGWGGWGGGSARSSPPYLVAVVIIQRPQAGGVSAGQGAHGGGGGGVKPNVHAGAAGGGRRGLQRAWTRLRRRRCLWRGGRGEGGRRRRRGGGRRSPARPAPHRPATGPLCSRRGPGERGAGAEGSGPPHAGGVGGADPLSPAVLRGLPSSRPGVPQPAPRIVPPPDPVPPVSPVRSEWPQSRELAPAGSELSACPPTAKSTPSL